jgi:hypothetical protein
MSVILLFVVQLSVFCAEWHSGMGVILLGALMLDVILLSVFLACHFARCHYDEYHPGDCNSSE